MSGIEAAGLVLGAISVLRTTLEQASKTANKSNNLIKRDALSRDIGYALGLLEEQQVMLQHVFRVLLRTSLASVEIDKVLSDPQDPRWRDGSIELAVRKSIDNSGAYDLLVGLLHRYFEAISSLEKILLLNARGEKILPKKLFEIRRYLASGQTKEILQALREQSQAFSLLTQLVHLTVSDVVQPLVEHTQAGDFEASVRKILDHQPVVEDLNPAGVTALLEDDIPDNYTVNTDVENEEEPTLPYLPLSIQAVGCSIPGRPEDALLDTGANLCAISMTTALKLGLSICKTEERVVRTSIAHNDLEVRGKVQVKLRWRDEDGKACGAKRWLYVVYGLTQSIVLSHDFIESHKEVWTVAKNIVDSAKSINYTFFLKRAEEQKVAEENFRRRRADENRRREEEEKRVRDVGLNAVDGASATVSAAGSSGASPTALTSSSASTSTQPL